MTLSIWSIWPFNVHPTNFIYSYLNCQSGILPHPSHTIYYDCWTTASSSSRYFRYTYRTHTHTLSFPLKTNAFVRKCKNSRNSERRISDWLRLGLQQRRGWARGQRKGGSNSARRRAGACAREPASSHDIAIFAWEMHESQASACSQRQERRKKEALQEETRSRAQLSDGSTSPTACAYAFFLLAR